MAFKCRTLFLIALLFFTSHFCPAAASPNLRDFQLELRNSTDTSLPLDCTTEFSGDYYGFGVRLGVYFAWLGSYFANTLLPSEISGSLDTNSIFLLALLLSLFKGTYTHEIYMIDGLIIMQLSSGFLFSSLSIWGYRTLYYQREGRHGINHFGGFGTHARIALVTAISVYGAWFWWEGLEDGLLTAQDEQCQKIYTWFFDYFSVTGGIHYFYILMSMATAIYYGTMVLTAFVVATHKLFRTGWAGSMKFETGYNVQELKILYKVFAVFNLFWMIFCSIMIEMTLNKNNMLETLAAHGDITYPSQLLPLLVGALSFLRVLWLIYKEGKERIEKESGAERARSAAGERPAKRSLYNCFGFSFDIRKLFTLPARPDPVLVSEVEQFRPWHYRYLVALLPWLSTFDFWLKADSNNHQLDEEQSPTSDIQIRYIEDRKDMQIDCVQKND